MGRRPKCTPDLLRKALKMMNEEGHSLTETARRLGVCPSALSRKLREYGYRLKWVKVKPEELRLFDEEEG